MKTMVRRALPTLLLSLTTLATPMARAETPAAATDAPMEAMARLVGGSWKIGPLTHVFEWGIGRHTLLARSYDSAGNFASEARWFWHPGEETIKGYSVDVTGRNLAEMTTSFEGDKMINVLVLSSPEASGETYVGEWVFVGDGRYDWALYKKTETGREKQFEATATRVHDEAVDGEEAQ